MEKAGEAKERGMTARRFLEPLPPQPYDPIGWRWMQPAAVLAAPVALAVTIASGLILGPMTMLLTAFPIVVSALGTVFMASWILIFKRQAGKRRASK